MFMSKFFIPNLTVILYFSICVLLMKIEGKMRVLESHLGLDDSSHKELDVPTTVNIVRLSCPHGSQWIIPNSIPETKGNNNTISVKPWEIEGSLFTLNLPSDSSDRGHWRGLYECCSLGENVLSAYGNLTYKWIRRQRQPSCCPCCPWYEQERCRTQSENPMKAGEYQCTHSVFLYTQAIPGESVQLHIVPGEPMLVPCPALWRATNWWPEIQLQIVPKYSVGWPWFPFRSVETQHISYTYDPRYGLCLNKSQFQRPIPYLLCYYPQVNRTRTIQLVWPPPPPTVAPKLKIQFTPPGNFSKQTQATFDNPDVPLELAPIYRVRWGSYFHIYCIASYNQTGIVKRPPPRLCFKWHLYEMNVTRNMSDHPDHRKLSDCPTVQRVTNSLEPQVYAFSTFELPPVRANMSLECEVVTPARQAPSTSKTVQFAVLPPNNVVKDSKQLHWYVEPRSVLHPDVHSVAVMDLAYGRVLQLYFWHTHEVEQLPTCIINISNSRGAEINHTLSVQRVLDQWRCRITFASASSSYVGHIVLGYGDDYAKLSLYVLNSSTWQRPRVVGMHNYALHPFNLTCKQDVELSPNLPKWADFQRKRKFTWFIEFNRTVTKIQSEENNTFELNPIYNETQIEMFTYPYESVGRMWQNGSTNYTFPTGQPSKLCVSCSVSYMFGSDRKSERECRYLVDFDTTDVDLSQMTLQTPPLLLLLRQPNMRTISSSETSVAAVIGSQPVDIQCLYLEEFTEPLPTYTWPVLKLSNYSYLFNLSMGDEEKPVFEVSSLWRGTRILIPQLKSAGLTEDIECELANRKVTMKLQSMDPIGPQIIQSKTLMRTLDDILQLTCYATGFPPPVVVWQLRNQTVLRDTGEEWISMKHCEALKNALNETFCVHNFTLNSSEEAPVVQCVAMNIYGRAVTTRHTQPSKMDVEFSSASAVTGQQTYIWIAILAVLASLLMGLSLLSLYICCWTKQTKKLGRTHRKCNILYTKCKSYSHFIHNGAGPLSHEWLSGNQNVMRVIADLLGSMEEAYKWTVPPECLQTSTVNLGLGHYGQVSKGWLSSHCSKTTNHHHHQQQQHRTGTDVEQNLTPIAIKAASGETSSLSCLRNEIAILPSLSCGPNIIRMIGLTLGVREDLRDTLLLLEYCPHKSLSEFIKKYAHQITDGTQRNHKWSIQSYDSGVCSLPDPEGGSTNNVNDRVCNNTTLNSDTLIKEHGELPDIGLNHNCVAGETEFHLTVCHLYRTAYQIACGLSYLAKCGIIHRDLATRNILIDEDFNPKICDFGLAVRVSTTEESTGGTTYRCEGYQILTHQKQLPFRILPPEALCEQTFYLASDIWEYGLLLWQLFSLEIKRPFSTVSTVNELIKLLYSTPQTTSIPTAPSSIDRPRLVHEQLWLFMCQAWRLDPKLRPSAQDFQSMLWNLLNVIHRSEDEATQEASDNPILYTEIVQSDSNVTHHGVAR